jgi:cell division protein FtsB
MTDPTQRLKRKVQYIVAGAMTLFFVLVTVLVFQFAVRLNLQNQESNLRSHSEYLKQQIAAAASDIEYFKSHRFVEDYALKYLNKGKPGDVIFD